MSIAMEPCNVNCFHHRRSYCVERGIDVVGLDSERSGSGRPIAGSLGTSLLDYIIYYVEVYDDFYQVAYDYQ
jgi:hypothetical protein